MAIVLDPRFPAPDRSGQAVKLRKDSDGCLDLGWCEGVLYDGRPFRVETWVQDQITMLTIFFSALGIEDVSEVQLSSVMESEGLVAYKEGAQRRRNECHIITDRAGNAMWSVNVPVGGEDETFVASTVRSFAYAGESAPTLFRIASTSPEAGSPVAAR
ncbi:MAG: hypothetical protein ACREOJ_09230 [Gemmatimonadaceae bacterium]